MKIIAIPHFGNRISSRFDTAQQFFIVSVENGKIFKKENVLIIDENPFKKINILKNFGIDILICDGLTKSCETYLISKCIQVFPWKQGNIEKILLDFIKKNIIQKSLNKDIGGINNEKSRCSDCGW